MHTPALVDRSRPSQRARGRTAAKVLLVLSAIFLVVGIVGIFVARNTFTNDLLPSIQKIGERVKATATEGVVVVPGEKVIEMTEAGGIAFGAFEKTEVGDKTYTFAPAGQLDLTVTAEDGTEIKVERPQGMQPIDMKKDGVLHLLGFGEIKTPGKYTVSAKGQDTAIYALTISAPEMETMKNSAVRLFIAAGASCCGIPLFLLLGIIGGILLIFGKKAAPLP
jgi:uncharacterized protein YneF (UPF0154 family)